MTAKAINQFVTFANFLVQAEGLLIGAKAGLKVDTLAQIIAVSSGRSLQLTRSRESFFRVISTRIRQQQDRSTAGSRI